MADDLDEGLAATFGAAGAAGVAGACGLIVGNGGPLDFVILAGPLGVPINPDFGALAPTCGLALFKVVEGLAGVWFAPVKPGLLYVVDPSGVESFVDGWACTVDPGPFTSFDLSYCGLLAAFDQNLDESLTPAFTLGLGSVACAGDETAEACAVGSTAFSGDGCFIARVLFQ